MKIRKKILHILSQRPSLTGSGITLEALVRLAAAAGWDQRVVVGVPADDPLPAVGGLDPDRIHPLLFGDASAFRDAGGHGNAGDGGDRNPATAARLDFALPGMSDVMPYRSTRFSSLSERRLAAYRRAFSDHIGAIAYRFRPDVIHSHHVWIVSSLLKGIAPGIPVVTHCHATGLRQMKLCPHLAGEVRAGCARNDLFAVLHEGHARDLAQALDLAPERIREVGAGYRDDLFHLRGRDDGEGSPPPRILYAGKYSASKGLPQLLDAFESLVRRMPGVELHIAGEGAGAEAEALRKRMKDLAPAVILHGQIDQPRLAVLMRRSTVFALPSFYEGIPLVLVEAAAAGCRLVATGLPGVTGRIAPALGDALHIVPMPRLAGVDTPRSEDLPRFTHDLEAALEAALVKGPVTDDPSLAGRLEPFTWNAVFGRAEAAWHGLIG